MTTLALTSGAYSARGVIANAQRCVNLWPESNPQETQPAQPVTHYLRPGLRRQLVLNVAQIRCLYTATNGDLYAVSGNEVYFISSGLVPQRLGFIQNGTNQVKMADNGVSILIADGSPTGYQIDMTSHVLSGIDAANNSGTNGFSYNGANYVDFVDTFLVGNTPGTPDWWSTASNALEFDPLSFASKSGLPDFVKGVVVVQRYVWVIGTYATELWSDVGNTNFPFAIVSGPYVEHGCLATYSIVKAKEAVLWLSQDRSGKAVFLRAEEYRAIRCSNYAIENEIQSYPGLEQTVGFTFTQGGHIFAGWRFPQADKTWIMDLETNQWHEAVSQDSDGLEHQWRVNCATLAYGMVLAGDYENGVIYQVDPTYYLDDTLPITRRRGFPHVIAELSRIRFTKFIVDLEVGNDGPNLGFNFGLLGDDGSGGTFGLQTESLVPLLQDPSFSYSSIYGDRVIWLRWSDTRGRSWSQPIQQSMGELGQFLVNIQFQRLGIARDRVFEVFWSYPCETALQAAYVSYTPGSS